MTCEAHKEIHQKKNKTPKTVIFAGLALGLSPVLVGIYFGATMLGDELEPQFASQNLSVESLMVLARDDAASNSQIRKVVRETPDAAKDIKALAQNGDMHAQTMWCWLNSGGIGVERNQDMAIEHCEKAAKQGSASAMQNLAYYYAVGNGVAQDEMRSQAYYKKAYDSYLVAADAGHPRSQYRVANMHMNGWVTVSWDVTWANMKKAADSGYPEALYEMGQASYKGEQFPRDYKKAAKYFHAAADQHYVDAFCKLSHMYREGAGVSQDIAKANKFLEHAVKHGQPHAVSDLAMALRHGADVEKDPVRAHKLMLKSALNEEVAAMSIVGINFLDGVGVVVDREAGLFCLEAAAELGHVNATTRLSLENLPPKENYKAAEKMALAYMNGDGVEKDLDKELTWFIKAAAQGSVVAKMRLSARYASGEGVEKSDANALYWMAHLTKICPVFKSQMAQIADRMNEADLEHTQKLYEQCSMSEFLNCVVDEI